MTQVALLALIATSAATWHVDPLLVQAIAFEESRLDPECITPNPDLARHLRISWGMTPEDAALESSDLGLLQVNPNQALRNEYAPLAWKRMQACDLLDPRINLRIGLQMFRWWLYKAALKEGVFQGPANYARLATVVDALDLDRRVVVYRRAVLAYTWPASLTAPDAVPLAKRLYAERVVRRWVDLVREVTP